ncbi:hypothetical protein [Halobellus limi]|uniref:Uncharacterized protein n=1 Tax=Halobellus limi TaxID=699433 RepID=A0A1H5ZF76_9EURY|nr:hypothetical protein [Halobellus limi]QCC48122.1 hypothetical protein DV707_10865 [Halobellus limi]SEG34714.1 hypothetical protein SAMN04488133_1964 [Halobellus limi]
MGEKDTPSLHEVLLYLKDSGIVGEEELALSLYTLLPNGGLVLLMGMSSTGKTNLLETVQKAYPKELFYEVSTSTSPVALFYDEARWNAHPIHIWPDLTELPEAHEGIAKAIGDRKPADHTVTDVTVEDVKNKLLNPGRTDIMVAATDNEKFNVADYAEIKNRSVQLFTDASQGLTEKILEREALDDAGLYEPELDESRAQEVREYSARIMRFASTFDAQGGSFLNPLSPEMTRNKVLPTLFPEARRDFGKLKRFIHSMALINNEERIKFFDSDGKPVLVVAPEDVWLAMKIFGEKMIMSSLNVSKEDVAIITLLRERKSAFSKAEIRQLLADPDSGAGLNISTRDVARRLDSLCDNGFVNEDPSTTPNTYYTGMFAAQIDHSTSLDWNEVIEAGIENARAALDEETAEEYVRRFCQNPTSIHPITGESVVIREDSSFDGELADATKELDEALSTPMWGSSDSGDSEEEKNDGSLAAESTGTKAQGTLT